MRPSQGDAPAEESNEGRRKILCGKGLKRGHVGGRGSPPSALPRHLPVPQRDAPPSPPRPRPRPVLCDARSRSPPPPERVDPAPGAKFTMELTSKLSDVFTFVATLAASHARSNEALLLAFWRHTRLVSPRKSAQRGTGSPSKERKEESAMSGEDEAKRERSTEDDGRGRNATQGRFRDASLQDEAIKCEAGTQWNVVRTWEADRMAVSNETLLARDHERRLGSSGLVLSTRNATDENKLRPAMVLWSTERSDEVPRT
eukprot:scaffold741_cov336-Pavlova_lutheri.AAC.65